MKRHCKRFALYTGLLFSLVLSNCKKENAIIETSQPEVSIPNFEKLEKFLSVTLHVSIDRIKYDEHTSEFYVPGTIYREKLTLVQERYDGANEYKLNFEN